MLALISPIVVLGALAAPQEPRPAKEWAQPHGNAAATACIDVAPLKSPPTERWRLRAEKLLAGPVISQGKLFAVLRDAGATQLVALDPATGATIAKQPLEGGGEIFELVAGDGLVALFDAKQVAAWRLAGGRLALQKSIAGSFGGEPLLFGTSFLAPRADGGLQSLDWTAGKATSLLAKSFGRPGVVDAESSAGESGAALVALVADGAERFGCSRFALASASPPLKLGAAKSLYGAGLGASPDLAKSVLVAVSGRDGSEWYAWLGGPRGGGVVRKSGFRLRELLHPPAAANGRLFGFDRDERLVEIDKEERNVNPLVEKANLRKGAQVGAPSIARDVLYLGNWAVEIGSKRVLWCLDAIEADGPAIPAGDELLVLRTKSQELVGFGNGPVGAAGAATASSAASKAPAELPGRKPGVIRSDGLFVPGKAVALEQGRWRVEPESGAPQELAADEVAFVDDGAKPKRVGEEHPIFRACWSVLAPRHADRLVACFEKWRELKLYDECRRLLDEARQHGLPAERADELQGTIAGKSAAKVAAAAPTRKKCLDFENEGRVDSSDEIVKAAKWCARNDAKTAASALLARALQLGPRGAVDPDLLELVEDWKPSTFPTELLADTKAKSWLDWADALLPSGATFAVLDDSTARRMSVTKFAEKSLALRTRNILLFSKELDPALLGPMLARGEATVRALQKILGPSPTGLTANAPLEVRLHLYRSDYLADRIIGSLPMAWSAGCYSPADGISRFYSKQEGDSGDPDGRTLHEVFAHELTHHYVDRRWVRDRPSGTSGSYWMIEGFAEFVAGQALEIGRLGEKFDDATVLSIDKAAAAARVEQLIPLEYLLALDGAHFHSELEGGAFGPVPLRHTLKEISLDKRGVFYAEATALTFFVMNRFGEKGRPTYLRWLQQVYGGNALQEPWKDLGFEDVWAFRKAFRAFLDSI